LLTVLIVYHSDYGNTERMAAAIEAGVKVGGAARVSRKQAADTTLDDLLAADLLLFGTPVHMGSMAWQMKQLVDRAGKLWLENRLEGKVGGVFASGGGFGAAGGGVESTMIGLWSHFLQQGMVVVGFPKSLPGYAEGGLQWGPYARCADNAGLPRPISDQQLAAARAFGAHAAETAVLLRGQ